MTEIFRLFFLFMLTATVALRLVLAQRQIRHVVSHRAEVPPAFAATIDLNAHQKAADYTVAKTHLAMVNALVDAIFLLWLTFGGGLNWLWAIAGTVFHGELPHGLALICAVMVFSSIIGLPFSLYSTFRIESRFGFNKTTLKLFVLDMLKATALSALIGLPLLTLVLWLMDEMGTHWWLWVWLVWAAFNLLLLLVYPTVIAPIFNKFQPLEDEPLRVRIEALLQRNGFASKGVFIMDGSKRSSHGNAYFTGFGGGKRIVFFDTLLKRLSPQEIEAVLAHELGHFRLKHIRKRIVFSFALSLVLLFILGQLMNAPWFYLGLGVTYPSTAMALMLFFMALPVITFPMTPLSSYFSRRHEYEADAFAVAQSDAGDLVNALTKLYRDNASTLTPDPLYSTFYDSHPPAALRIAHLIGEKT